VTDTQGNVRIDFGPAPGDGKKEAPPPPPPPPEWKPDVSSKPGEGSKSIIEEASIPPAKQSGSGEFADALPPIPSSSPVIKSAPGAAKGRPLRDANGDLVSGLGDSEKIQEVAPPPKDPVTVRELGCREKLLAKGVYLMADQPGVDLDDVVKNLATGTYRFNKPESAYVEEPFRVVLALPTAPRQDVSRAFSGAPGKIEEREAPVARYLQATLRGGLDFRVIPPDPQPRTVTTNAPVVWEWEVVPLRHGKKSLVIDVSANLLVGPHKELVQLQTLSEEIQINVGIVRWILSTFSGLPGIAFGIAAIFVIGLGALNYLRPGSVGGVARVAELIAGDEMPPGARSNLRAAILAGFDHESLDQVLRDKEMPSHDVVDTGSFARRVDSLIEVARQQGWLIKLCDALAEARSRNADVASPILAVRRQLADQETQAENAAARTEPRLG
jgi:Effector-associated domain 1